MSERESVRLNVYIYVTYSILGIRNKHQATIATIQLQRNHKVAIVATANHRADLPLTVGLDYRRGALNAVLRAP